MSKYHVCPGCPYGITECGLPMKNGDTCRRSCDHFWGEVGDVWACHGHWLLLRVNEISWEIDVNNEDDMNKYIIEPYKEALAWFKENPNPEKVGKANN